MGGFEFSWYRCWGLQAARKFHPWRCGSLRNIIMFDVHPHFFCTLVGGFLGGSFCLNISDNLLMECNFIPPMDTNGAVGSDLGIFSIKSNAALVADY